MDYVQVFEEEEMFQPFRDVFNPSVERIGYFYDPIDIQDRIWI